MSHPFNRLPPPSGFWNEAFVYGDLASGETQPVLSQTLPVLTNFSSKAYSGTWRSWKPTVEVLTDQVLSAHPASRKKDGHSVVFANSAIERYETVSGVTWELCSRRKEDILAITAAGFDIDRGRLLPHVVERLQEPGLFSILYTTHSHGKTVTRVPWPRGLYGRDAAAVEDLAAERDISDVLGFEFESDASGDVRVIIRHRPVDKFRVIFPLAEPFRLADLDRRERALRCFEWAERLTGFAQEKLGVEIDPSGCDVNRLFYTPRHHPAAKEWGAAVFAGRALALDDMPRVSTRRRRLGRKSGRAAGQTGGERPVLSDGFDLLDWWSDFGDRFLIVDFLEALAWEIRRGGRPYDYAEVECPNDAAHSNSGDPNDRACWVHNADGDESFALTCRHGHCLDLGKLEMLVMLEPQVCLPEGVESFSELLCREEFYLGAPDDE